MKKEKKNKMEPEELIRLANRTMDQIETLKDLERNELNKIKREILTGNYDRTLSHNYTHNQLRVVRV